MRSVPAPTPPLLLLLPEEDDEEAVPEGVVPDDEEEEETMEPRPLFDERREAITLFALNGVRAAAAEGVAMLSGCVYEHQRRRVPSNSPQPIRCLMSVP